MSRLAEEIAIWIWDTTQLDQNDESWQGMMFEDAVRQIDKLITVSKGGDVSANLE